MTDVAHVPGEHPGLVLRRICKETQRELAEMLGVSPACVSLISNGRRSITPNIAVRLERIGYGDARQWLIIQADHDIALERRRD